MLFRSTIVPPRPLYETYLIQVRRINYFYISGTKWPFQIRRVIASHCSIEYTINYSNKKKYIDFGLEIINNGNN